VTNPTDTAPSRTPRSEPTPSSDQPEAGTPGDAPTPREHTARAGHHREVRGLKVGVRIALILLILFVAGAIFMLLLKLKPESKIRSDIPAPVLVRGVDVTPRSIDRVWEGFGTAASMRRSRVAAEVTGRVVERPSRIEPGRSVDAGALLVAIDPTDYATAVARAEQGAVALRAQLDGLAVESERLGSQLELVADEIAAAERDLDRTRQAVEQGAGSQGEIDVKIAQLRRSQREQQTLRQALETIPSRRLTLEGELGVRVAELEQAKENLRRTRVVSPIAGEIESIEPRLGDWAAAGSPVGVIVDLTRLEVPLRLPASAASWIRVGDSVNLWAGEPVGDPSHTGRVMRLGPAADAGTRTIAVFVEVTQDPTTSERLLPGVFVHGRISTPDPQERVAVPRAAIRSGRVLALTPGPDGFYVVTPVDVTIAYAIDASLPEIDELETEWAVLERSGELPAGSLIATTSIEQLVVGARVRVEGTDSEHLELPPEDSQDGADTGGGVSP